jgi:hydroxymethylpyrimidine pyrophosphatase-like HAD family hydrolase
MKLTLLSFFTLTAAFGQTPKPWRDVLDDRLKIYGHRNWIVVADSAYPLQSNPGIETIFSTESQVETVRHVLEALRKAPHIRPIVYTDKELQFVPEQDAVGIDAYRQLLTGIFERYLPDQKPSAIAHDTVIRQLDDASKTFNVLIVKTNMALPYTSVFFELRAGYWSDEAERRLRDKMR